MATASSSLPSLVEKFCSEGSSKDETDAAFAAISSELSTGGLTLLKLVEASGEFLTNTDDGIRNRATMLLAEALHEIPGNLLAADQLPPLLAFLSDRMKDEPCIKEVLRASFFLLDRYGDTVHETAAASLPLAKLVVAMLQGVHVQSLPLANRHNVYSIMQTVLDGERYKEVLSGLDINMVDAFGHCMDGERDPRNLLLCFTIIPLLTQQFLKTKEEAENLFPIFSCYFPITFTPPPNDTFGITAEMLREGLLNCMTCSLLMAPRAFDLALGKLAAGDLPLARLDSLDVMATLATKFGMKEGVGTSGARQAWSAIRLQIVDSGEAEVQQRARSCLRVLLRQAAEEDDAVMMLVEQEGDGAAGGDAMKV
eukprot:CAMPEP_0181296998 /NCGR_PEP_ID=MMETSP1101-20121128/5000_1 /TAXON_ID=46948 /ORGANISM="Rhodomonas abbreviata, Strain Caron Lab Isolate" /LENGTH=367 /DNA_ID=CAMNT_0023401895 /DNA_START=25 /DNA_END=1125 /DNA_ORIENTATION=+